MVFLKIKVKACILIHPIKFGIILLKYPILLILPEKIEKNIAIQTNVENFPSRDVGREH